jgi:hypothetical protein
VRRTIVRTAAPPTIRARPTKSSHRLTRAGTVGEGEADTVVLDVDDEGTVLMPKANEPPVTWPSVFDTVRQFTV